MKFSDLEPYLVGLNKDNREFVLMLYTAIPKDKYTEMNKPIIIDYLNCNIKVNQLQRLPLDELERVKASLYLGLGRRIESVRKQLGVTPRDSQILENRKNKNPNTPTIFKNHLDQMVG